MTSTIAESVVPPTTVDQPADHSVVPPADVEADVEADVLAELLVEEISIDGMCGVY
jgi:mycofactocin precursor